MWSLLNTIPTQIENHYNFSFPTFFSFYMNMYSHYYTWRNVLSSLRDMMMGQIILASEGSLYINEDYIFVR